MSTATLHLGEGKGITLPTWFLAGCLAAFFTASGWLIVTSVDVNYDVRDNKAAISDFKTRIERLEANQQQIAVLNQKIDDINAKVDLLVSEEQQRRPK